MTYTGENHIKLNNPSTANIGHRKRHVTPNCNGESNNDKYITNDLGEKNVRIIILKSRKQDWYNRHGTPRAHTTHILLTIKRYLNIPNKTAHAA